MGLTEFVVIGRALPTEADPKPTIYKMAVFARNEVVAKSRFWVFIARLKKVKRSHGEIISVETIPHKGGLKARNYGVLLRYNSRTGTHNVYKEFRDVTRTGAVQQLFDDMAARHKANQGAIQIISVTELKNNDCKRANVKQFHGAHVKFPLTRHFLRPARKTDDKTFVYKKINPAPL